MAHGHWQCKSASQLGFQPCLHLGAICLCLRALRTCGGRATPSVNKPREWGCCGGPLPSLWGCVGYGVLVVDLGSVAHTPGREYHSPVPHSPQPSLHPHCQAPLLAMVSLPPCLTRGSGSCFLINHLTFAPADPLSTSDPGSQLPGSPKRPLIWSRPPTDP